MKNFKRVAAIAGVVVLLAVFCLPMIFALGGGENANGMFMASLGALILVPVLGYAFMMVYRVVNKKDKEADCEVKNIIFDVGQVLVKFDWETYLKSFHFPEEEFKDIAENVFFNPLWNERDKGELTEEEYVEQFVACLPQYEADVREVLRRSAETVTIMDYAETWTKYLKEQGYHLYILSNYCEHILDGTIDQMGFLKYMDGVIFSCHVNQIKPDPGIFHTLLNRYGLKAGECVFLDDNAANCKTSRSLGIHTIQFTSFKQGAAELEKLGIK